MENRIPVIFRKFTSTHSKLCDVLYKGWAAYKPSVGSCFALYDKQKLIILTTAVKTVRYNHDGTMEFDTKNSTYHLTFISTGDEKVYLDPIENDLVSTFARHGITTKMDMIEKLRILDLKLCGNTNA